MPSAAHAPIFLLYAGAAYYALWVIGEQNDIAPGAIKLCTSGVLGLLVAFFHSATSLPQTAPFQTFFGSILAVPLVIILVESSRANNPALIRWSALAAGAVCQLAGAAIAVPVWMALYSLLNIPKAATGSSKRIRSITPAFTASFFGLALLMSNEGGFLTKDQAFIGSALWQAFPIWVSILQVVIPTFLPDNGTTAASAKRTTQTFFALLTTVVYWKALYTLHEVAETTGSTYGEVIWSIVNIPLHPKSHSEATHLFLLFDCAVVTVTTLTFVVSGAKSKAKMLLAITAMAPIVGPGAAFAWGWRSWDVEGGVAKGKKRA
ncbi:hypothetical protein RQP46_007078 [Phenoliferia psychrophenolica]